MDTRHEDYLEGLTSTAQWWAARDAHLHAEASAAAAHAASPRGQLEQAQRHEDAMRAARTDSGAYSDEEIDTAVAERVALQADVAAAAHAVFAAEWSREVTAQRRAAWNARVRASEFGAPGSGRIDYAALRRAERKQGWTALDLRHAVQLHGL